MNCHCPRNRSSIVEIHAIVNPQLLFKQRTMQGGPCSCFDVATIFLIFSIFSTLADDICMPQNMLQKGGEQFYYQYIKTNYHCDTLYISLTVVWIISFISFMHFRIFFRDQRFRIWIICIFRLAEFVWKITSVFATKWLCVAYCTFSLKTGAILFWFWVPSVPS
jgi:hypothetical protein